MEIAIFTIIIIILIILFYIIIAIDPKLDKVVVNNTRYRIVWYTSKYGRNYKILWKI